MRKSFRFLASLALVTAWLGGAASAHALLLAFNVDGQEAVLHYNGRVDAARSRVTLVDKDGTNPRKLDILAGDDAATLKAHLGELAPGAYALRWEVLSVDGHISRGEQPVTIPTP